MERKVPDAVRDAATIVVGSAIFALTIDWLFQPNQIVTGGVTGIGQVLHRLLPVLPVGVVGIALNAPLFALLARRQGVRSCLRSFFAMVAGNIMIDLLDAAVSFPPMKNQFLACVFAGVLFGFSIGLQLRAGITTGGSDLAARLLKYRFHHISIGRLCLIIDLTIIAAYAVVFRSVDGALSGIVAMYISSLTMDTVVYGSTRARMAVIISDKKDDLVRTLLAAHFGVTRMNGQGAYQGRSKDVLLTTFRPNQITTLKQAVLAIDPGAFLIVCDAHEVIGEGFASYSEDAL